MYYTYSAKIHCRVAFARDQRKYECASMDKILIESENKQTDFPNIEYISLLYRNL